MSKVLYIIWDVDPVIFSGLPLRYYGLLFVLGLVFSGLVLAKIYRDKNKPNPSEFTYNLSFYCLLGVIVGARLGHCFFYDPGYFLAHPLEIILPFTINNGNFFWTGYAGLASHGGVIGIIIALWLFSKKTGENILDILNNLALVAPLGACFIRLANLMNSEIIGTPTNVPWAFIFTRVDFVPRHPAQLYEALAYLLLFFVMMFLYEKYDKKLKRGFYFGLCLTYVFTFRFLIEFVKERQVEFEESMTLDMGQLLSIPFILFGIYFLFFYKAKVTNKE